MIRLGPSQRRVYDFICDHLKERGHTPVGREIMDRFGLSHARVYHIVEILVARGYLTRRAGKWRGLEVV